MRPPREHGFWVMLLIALAAGVSMKPRLGTLAAAVLLALVTTFLAMGLRRRIRKNEPLQAIAAVSLGLLPLPIAVVGGSPFPRIVALVIPLCLVFLATTLAVQAVLLRARRKRQRAMFLGGGALFLASASAFVAAFTGRMHIVGALAPTVLLLGFFLLFPPSPQQLKRVGISVATAQTMAALLLVLP